MNLTPLYDGMMAATAYDRLRAALVARYVTDRRPAPADEPRCPHGAPAGDGCPDCAERAAAAVLGL